VNDTSNAASSEFGKVQLWMEPLNVKQQGDLMAHLFETTGKSYIQNITNPIKKADTCFFTLTVSVH
jgi:hypothetical protein